MRFKARTRVIYAAFSRPDIEIVGRESRGRLIEFSLIYCRKIQPEACEVNIGAVWTKTDGDNIYERLGEG